MLQDDLPSCAELRACVLQMCTVVAYTSSLDRGLYEMGQQMDQLVAGQLTGGWAGAQAAAQRDRAGACGSNLTCTPPHAHIWVLHSRSYQNV